MSPDSANRSEISRGSAAPALVLMALTHLSFTNDTADAVLSKGIELSPLAVGAMYAAGTAWDRYVRRPEDGEEEAG